MDNRTFSYLYQEYYKSSFLFVKSYIRDEMAAEDIVSDALFHLWQTMRKEHVEYPHALLVTILKNTTLNHLKHEQIKHAVTTSISDRLQRDLHYRIITLQACDPEEIFSAEISEIVKCTLASLPEQTQRIFEMSRYEHLSVKEIAQELNISSKSIEYHITKSLKALRIALKEYLPLFFFCLHYKIIILI